MSGVEALDTVTMTIARDSAERNWLIIKMTANMVENQSGSRDMTQSVEAKFMQSI